MKTPQEVTDAIAQYEINTQQLDTFIQHNQSIIDDYNNLLLARNNAIDMLKHAITENVKALRGSAGPYKISVPRSLDPFALLAVMQDEAEPYIKKKLTVNTRVFDAACDEGLIPSEVTEIVTGEGSPRLTGPKPIPIYLCS